MGTFSLFQSPSMRDVEPVGEEEAGVSSILGVSGSSSESAHLPICFKSLDGVANTKPGLLSADASRSWSENAAAAAGEGDDGIGSRDGEDGTSADVDTVAVDPWRSGAAASAAVDVNGGRSEAEGDSDSCASVAGVSIARQLRGGETERRWDSSHYRVSREHPGREGLRLRAGGVAEHRN